MRRIFYIALFLLALSGCGSIHPYRPDVSQGNLINMDNVNKLRLGMTQDQVIHIMGSPVLQNIFADNRLTYIYTLWPNRGPSVRKAVILTFRNNQLVSIKQELPKS